MNLWVDAQLSPALAPWVGAFSDYAGGNFERPELIVSGFTARYRSARSGVCGFEQPVPTGQLSQPSEMCPAMAGP